MELSSQCSNANALNYTRECKSTDQVCTQQSSEETEGAKGPFSSYRKHWREEKGVRVYGASSRDILLLAVSGLMGLALPFISLLPFPKAAGWVFFLE